ncbi:MAG TPA: DUF4129 domain-containing protein [Candidatus Acetothermia bacterium]|nr:DUF4129 domain-containing protein [Candidatus Acetothermia bacterium]
MRKSFVLATGLGLLLCLALIAGGLSQLNWSPGRATPSPLPPPQEGEPGGVFLLPHEWTQVLFLILKVVFLTLFALAALGLLISREYRRRAFLLLALGLAILLLFIFLPPTEEEKEPQEEEPPPGPALELPVTENPSQQPLPPAPPPPLPPADWRQWLVALPFAALAAWWLVYRYLPRRAAPPPQEEVREVLQEAHSALRAGAPLEDVVIRCWVKMLELLSPPDSPALTPAELARLLRRQGFDHQAIDTLTRLFEEVRYGRKASEPRRQAALAALAALERAYG